MFYHDHAMGITRLNVYAGEAAGYVITDQVDAGHDQRHQRTRGVNPGLHSKVLPDIGIPLVIQDRTFVDADHHRRPGSHLELGTRAGTPAGTITNAVTGDLWYPHVYMSAQNPWDLARRERLRPLALWSLVHPADPRVRQRAPGGCIEWGPLPNPYHQADCDLVPRPGCTAPWEPPLMPGTPNPSMPGEAFIDTPIVNGTAYPYLDVEPKAYRFRILNAANDRFFNLQLYVAADKTTPTTPGTIGTVLCDPTSSSADRLPTAPRSR